MSVQKQVVDDTQVPNKPPAVSDDQTAAATGSKEAEPANIEEEKLLKEVVERSREADLDAAKKFEEALGKEAGLSRPEIKIPADLSDHGVKSPQVEASAVARRGSTVELPISENEYKTGKKIAVTGSDDHKSIIGVSSLAALIMYFGRIIKLAHKHAKRVIFRRPPAQRASGPEGDS